MRAGCVFPLVGGDSFGRPAEPLVVRQGGDEDVVALVDFDPSGLDELRQVGGDVPLPATAGLVAVQLRSGRCGVGTTHDNPSPSYCSCVVM